MERALDILQAAPPDVMNHNLETAPRLYRQARPGSDYAFSLKLLKRFKELVPGVPTKSGVMVGLGETDDEIVQVMRDLRAHDVDMLTIGQYSLAATAASRCSASRSPATTDAPSSSMSAAIATSSGSTTSNPRS